ncbi:sensor histidine kinase [Streptococcus cuniculi]|nr:histidine kinase [Streptococcus cuniculi]
MRRSKITYSLDSLSKILTSIMVGILAINLFISYIYITNVKKQHIAQISNTLDIFTSSLSKEIKASEHFMYWIILHDDSFEELANSTSYTEYITSLQKIRSRVSDFKRNNQINFTFFIQNDQSPQLVNISSMNLSYADFLRFDSYIQKEKQADGQWHRILLNNEIYFYQAIQFRYKTIYSLASEKAILQTLQPMEIGQNGSLSLEQPADTSLSPSSVFSNLNLVIAEKQRTKLPFNIYVTVDYRNAFKETLSLQLIMLLTPIIICLISLLIVRYVQKKIMVPVKRLTAHLKGDTPYQVAINSEGIIEIDSANNHINHLFHEIRLLKQDIYERELKQRKIEMDYLKNQIKPHFYLNILSMIHSMIETQHYSEITQLTLSTSHYFRYLFQSQQTFVTLKDEIKHVEDYLAIQTLRYGESFSYSSQIEKELLSAKIPPLVLQTFIENIFKHSFSIDSPLTIQLRIGSDANRPTDYQIRIEDNGPGFPIDILTKLARKESIIDSEGKHVGLTNTYERLDSIYASHYRLQLGNNATRGAYICLTLPIDYRLE